LQPKQLWHELVIQVQEIDEESDEGESSDEEDEGGKVAQPEGIHTEL